MTEPEPTILIIEPDTTFSSQLKEALEKIGRYRLVVTEPGISVRYIEGYQPAVGIVGASLDLHGCMKCVQKLKIVDPAMPVLVFFESESLTGGSLSGPFEAVYRVRLGMSPSDLGEILNRAMAKRAETEPSLDFPVLIGSSHEIQKIRTQIDRISDKDITVLITGESGTGKELIARSIHYHSPRRNGPLLKINCGALPDDLLESEVFGFQRGAFTGAHKNKPGRLELAHGGTLFIDEIGDLSLALQVKFLQVLEDKSFSRLGSVQDKTVDARVIAATNTDLWKMVREGKFRKDLYYRLNVVHIVAPPLRRRKEDLPLLADYFMNKYCYELKREPLELSSHVLDALKAYAWPGNVRELENVVRRAIVLREWDFIFKELDLDLALDKPDEKWPLDKGSALIRWGEGTVRRFMEEKDFSLKVIAKKYVAEVEKGAIIKALKQTHWNRRQAARLLGVSYKTLLNRIAELNLRPT
ncbi:MAG: hypothetical protein DRH11_15330 [Deltaproteobacteria bacterium]|nr:sigma-54-dependent Fis family transcriptional regulator [Deltaproteobacteria bacterium]MBW1929195.1 sigma-54-dependent Fis family transcriptional regulator [Deltaproteobacteria bacterium]RLB30032.1 MAG: hypothetical protein DRH11_15330 [Deltaproteobacteria bacterium]